MLGPLVRSGRAGLGLLDRLAWYTGTALRESGMALDRLGAAVQGEMAFDDEVPRSVARTHFFFSLCSTLLFFFFFFFFYIARANFFCPGVGARGGDDPP
jgi:hypothetical protein